RGHRYRSENREPNSLPQSNAERVGNREWRCSRGGGGGVQSNTIAERFIDVVRAEDGTDTALTDWRG